MAEIVLLAVVFASFALGSCVGTDFERAAAIGCHQQFTAATSQLDSVTVALKNEDCKPYLEGARRVKEIQLK